MAWELEEKGTSTIRSPFPLLPTCHRGSSSTLSRPLCHDRLSPLNSRTLKLSVPGDAGVAGIPAQLHTWIPPLHDPSGGQHPDHLHVLPLPCPVAGHSTSSDVMYLLVFCFHLSGNVFLQTHLACLPMTVPRPGKSRCLKVPAQ